MCFVCAYICDRTYILHAYLCGGQRRALSILLYFSALSFPEIGYLIEARTRLAARIPSNPHVSTPNRA